MCADTQTILGLEYGFEKNLGFQKPKNLQKSKF